MVSHVCDSHMCVFLDWIDMTEMVLGLISVTTTLQRGARCGVFLMRATMWLMHRLVWHFDKIQSVVSGLTLTTQPMSKMPSVVVSGTMRTTGPSMLLWTNWCHRLNSQFGFAAVCK